MAELKEPETASEKLAAFIERSKKVLIPLLIVLICILIGYIITSVVLTNGKAKDLQTLDEIHILLLQKVLLLKILKWSLEDRMQLNRPLLIL